VIPEHITREVEALRQEGLSLDVIEADGWYNLVFHNHPIPTSFNKPHSDLLIKLPISYRNGAPDMFWTDPELDP
jgi:Prokaryotic E2 family E